MEGSELPAVPGTAELPAELQDYPVQLGVVEPAEYNRWLPLVKWLLAIPHYFALVFLGIGALVVLVIAFFAVLFTGDYPRGMFDYLLGVQRWALRVSAYVLLMVDEYPPFTLDDDPSYPARLEIAYPEEGVDNWRPLVHWLLIIPYMFVAGAAGLGRGDHHDHRVLRDPLHEGVPAGPLRFQRDRSALADPGECLLLLHGDAVPAVRLGLSSATRPSP